MMASVTDLGSMPSMRMSSYSQTACSSAVRMAEVCWRHSPTMRSPSTTPNLMFVLLQLMASSMPSSYSTQAARPNNSPDTIRRGPDAVSSSKAPSSVDAAEAAAHQLVAQLHIHLGAQRAGLGQPMGAHRLEAVAPPFGQPLRRAPAVNVSSAASTEPPSAAPG